jgi:ketosteroid isomerase-like protein
VSLRVSIIGRPKRTAAAIEGKRNMNMRPNCKINLLEPHRGHGARCTIAVMTLFLVCVAIKTATAAPEDEVRAAFDRFVAAQNAHDIDAVESLLLRSPDFLWITRGAPVWGVDEALKRFTALYAGTWRLEPEPNSLRVTMIGDSVAQIYMPIVFTIGAAGQPPQKTRFLMNQVLVKTPSGWRVSSILPIPAPAQ